MRRLGPERMRHKHERRDQPEQPGPTPRRGWVQPAHRRGQEPGTEREDGKSQGKMDREVAGMKRGRRRAEQGAIDEIGEVGEPAQTGLLPDAIKHVRRLDHLMPVVHVKDRAQTGTMRQ